jgi:ribonuclease P protein component
VDNRFPAQCRLTSKNDIQAVFARRDVFRGERLVFYRGISPGSEADKQIEENFSRFCLNVSKKCGHAARRNRIKRILREIIRHNRQRIASGYDIVIRVDAARLRETVTEKEFIADFARYFGWN